LLSRPFLPLPKLLFSRLDSGFALRANRRWPGTGTFRVCALALLVMKRISLNIAAMIVLGLFASNLHAELRELVQPPATASIRDRTDCRVDQRGAIGSMPLFVMAWAAAGDARNLMSA
jgi:hypothetical protein